MANAILVSSASGKVPLIKALQNSRICIELGFEVIAGDSDPNSISFNFCKAKWIMPRIDDENLDEIIAGCIEHNIKIIFPTRDGELRFYARNKKVFLRNQILVLVADENSVEMCFDKKLFSDYLSMLDFPVIPSYFDLEALNSIPVAVKERFGSGSKKIGLGLRYEDAIFFGNSLANPIFQPMVAGKEFSVDLWVSQDLSSAIASPRTRDFVVDGEAKITSTFQSQKIEDLAIKLATALKLTGISVLQGFILANGETRIIECNARFGGATTASINSGIPLFDLALFDLLGEPTEKILLEIERKQLKQVRAPFDYYF
jgi:carbamoyl-phosphate synthase large subunit